MLETSCVPTRHVATQIERALDAGHARHAVSSLQKCREPFHTLGHCTIRDSMVDYVPYRIMNLAGTCIGFQSFLCALRTLVSEPYNTCACASRLSTRISAG